MPGSSLPSRYSRLAPPPVEMWPNASSSKPRLRTAAAESPPPTTERPSTFGQRLGDGTGAVGERGDLEDPHRAVPEDRPGVGERGRERRRRTPDRCRGRARRPGSASAGRPAAPASASPDGNAVSTTMSVGSTISHARLLRALEVVAADVELVLLEQALADLVALGLEEREDHAAADQQLVGLAEQVVDDAELVGDLRAAEHDDVGPLGVDGQPPQHVDLGGHQPAHRVREPLRHVVHGGLLAVHDAEPVGDERVGERGELVGERAALGVVLAGLAGVEADVLQQRDLAVGEAVDRRAGRVADGVGGERDVGAEQLAEPGGHRAQRVAVLGRALRAAEVGGHDHPGAGVGERLDRRHAGPDPAVVGDRGAVERDVQVGADQDPLAARRRRRSSSSPPRSEGLADVGRSGRRGGWSSPTRCRTSRRP